MTEIMQRVCVPTTTTCVVGRWISQKEEKKGIYIYIYIYEHCMGGQRALPSRGRRNSVVVVGPIHPSIHPTVGMYQPTHTQEKAESPQEDGTALAPSIHPSIHPWARACTNQPTNQPTKKKSGEPSRGRHQCRRVGPIHPSVDGCAPTNQPTNTQRKSGRALKSDEGTAVVIVVLSSLPPPSSSICTRVVSCA